MKIVSKLIKDAGGYMEVAILAGVSESAVKKWVNLSIIPEKHWEIFLEKKVATLAQLYKINSTARK